MPQPTYSVDYRVKQPVGAGYLVWDRSGFLRTSLPLPWYRKWDKVMGLDWGGWPPTVYVTGMDAQNRHMGCGVRRMSMAACLTRCHQGSLAATSIATCFVRINTTHVPTCNACQYNHM